MNEDMYVVLVDTRGMVASQIDGYEEHTCSQHFFDEHVLFNRKVKCIKSKVAELCGLDMKVYFHEYSQSHIRHLGERPQIAVAHEQEELYPCNVTNDAATLLTFDPRTGFPEYKITGKAFAVVDSGDYPLSTHQVWGIQDLISEARDFYHCDPEHSHRGRRELRRFCQEYRDQTWGPLTIYEPRAVEDEISILSFKKKVPAPLTIRASSEGQRLSVVLLPVVGNHFGCLVHLEFCFPLLIHHAAVVGN